MKRILGLILSVIVFVGCANPSKTPVRQSSPLIKHLGDSTVALVLTTKDGEVHPYCTGVWVGADEILTANHCVEANANYLARMNRKNSEGDDGEGAPVDPVGTKVHYVVEKEAEVVGEEPSAIHLSRVVAVDVDHDLALVKAVVSGMPEHDVATLPSELPAIGDHIWVVGQPKGVYWSYVEGTVSNYRSEMPYTGIVGPYIQVNGTVWFGNSGGGAFDSSGHLIGIASRLVRIPNMSLFIHTDSIKKFMKEYHEPAEKLGKK